MHRGEMGGGVVRDSVPVRRRSMTRVTGSTLVPGGVGRAFPLPPTCPRDARHTHRPIPSDARHVGSTGLTGASEGIL